MSSRIVLVTVAIGLAAWGTALVPWVAADRARPALRALVILAGSLTLAVCAASSAPEAFMPTLGVMAACSVVLFGGARFLRGVGFCPMAATVVLEVAWWLVLASPFLAAPVVAAPELGLDGQTVTRAIAAVHPLGVLLDAGWDIDWFRADHLYDASPLGSHFFRYPAAGRYAGVLIVAGGTALLIAAGIERLKQLRRS